MWGLHVECSFSAEWDIHVQYDRHICSGTYTKDVKCMYTSAHSHIVDCIEFIWGKYTDIVF